MRTERLVIVACLTALGVACSEAESPDAGTKAPVSTAQVPAPASPADSGVATDGGSALPVTTLPVQLLNLVGAAQIKAAGSTEWVELKVGHVIHEGDTIRTNEDGNVELSAGGARMKVDPGSEVQVRSLSPQTIRIGVSGHVEAEIAPGETAFEAEGSQGVATSKGGHLWLSSDAHGSTAVAAVDGAVAFSAGGKTVRLGNGEFVTVRGHGGWSKPARIPKAVSLKVAWPHETETNKDQMAVTGKASLFTRVFVQGKLTEVSRDGDTVKFNVQVPLKRGRQVITVSAVDPLGRKATQARGIVMDPDAPSIRGKVRYR